MGETQGSEGSEGGVRGHEAVFNSGVMGALFSLPDMKHLNQSRIPVYLSHIPQGTSTKNLVHWAQAVKSNNFQRYDYGSEGCSSFEEREREGAFEEREGEGSGNGVREGGVEGTGDGDGDGACGNAAAYGAASPPAYDLEGTYRVPTVLVSGGRDPISNARDVDRLAATLEKAGALIARETIPTYDHNDFTLAMDGAEALFPLILSHLMEGACPHHAWAGASSSRAIGGSDGEGGAEEGGAEDGGSGIIGSLLELLPFP